MAEDSVKESMFGALASQLIWLERGMHFVLLGGRTSVSTGVCAGFVTPQELKNWRYTRRNSRAASGRD